MIGKRLCRSTWRKGYAFPRTVVRLPEATPPMAAQPRMKMKHSGKPEAYRHVGRQSP